MRHELDVQLAEGGQILAMAASGSQDLSLAAGLMQKVRTQWRQRRGVDPGDMRHAAPAAALRRHDDADVVVPVRAADRDLPRPGHPACVVGDITRVREKEDCHRIMEWIAEAHQVATGIPTIYHRHEDDLLTQIRSVVAR